MSEPTAPKLKLHHGYRSWTTSWWDKSKSRRTKRFGREGDVTAKQAKARYDHWMATRYTALEHVRDSGATAYTVSEIASRYSKYAEETYKKDGKVTSHVAEIKSSMTALTAFCGDLPAAEIEGHQIARLRDSMIQTDVDGVVKVRSMKTVNYRLANIKAAFKWAAIERGLIPESVAVAVAMVRPLAKGRSTAKDPKDILPVEETMFWDTVKECTPTVAAMLTVQWWTGMRPGEVCIMRGIDIKTTGQVWTYTPHRFKTAHLGKTRVVAIGPKGQKAIKPFLDRDPQKYLFSPAESEEYRREQQHLLRRTPMNEGNRPGYRNVDNPKWKPRERYDAGSFRKAVMWACRRAGIKPAWHPNQVRHAYATRVREITGIEDASLTMGHSNIQTTELYAERSLIRAKEIAARVG